MRIVIAVVPRLVLLVTLLGARGSSAAETVPQGKSLGLGIVIGQPTGLSLKAPLGGAFAVDGALGWRFGDEAGLRLNVDLLAHHTLARTSPGIVSFYLGVGPSLGAHKDQVGLAIRVPVGLALLFRGAPIDAFIELAPGIGLYPGTTFFVNLALGARYYF